MLVPGQENLTIYRGSDFTYEFFFTQSDGVTAMDLTGWAAQAQARSQDLRTSTLLFDFTVTIPTPTNGKVYLAVSRAITGGITVNKGYYDLPLTNPSDFEQPYVKGVLNFKAMKTVVA